MRIALILPICLLAASRTFGGMPAILPENPERILRLGDTPLLRLQTFSFFLLVFLLSAALVKFLWNSLRRDIPSLPRLSFGRAVAGVLLWGLLFVIVLTMISGARELMTPGAWRKQGFTYKLAGDAAPSLDPFESEVQRRQNLEKLGTALLHFAATHNGKFPTLEEVKSIPNYLWEMPEAGGMRYIYRPGLTAQQVPEIIAYEPEIVQNRELVLKTNCDILLMTTAEIQSQKAAEKKP